MSDATDKALATDGQPPIAAGEEAAPEPTMKSVHTPSFPALLSQLGISVAVTTYQAGKLVLLRSDPQPGGPVLNTHFRGFDNPMGFIWEPGRLAIGTKYEVWEFNDIPAIAHKLDIPESPARHDSVFLPRTCHVTGDIQVHEMLWVPPVKKAAVGEKPVPSELWFINTRFSCLATRSGTYSFEPRWVPPFITSLAAEDRCHLNGMCLRDGKLRYITALGATDAAAGWRANKPGGGILMEIPSGEVIVSGLSMPHSPRWHNGQLWMLESGNGGFGIVDLAAGRYREILRLPGFTRGIDFAGPFAFIGLSQVRESATFSGIAIAEMPQEQRCCGVWMVDLRNGKIAGFVKFTDAVQEVFAVQVLRGLKWPDVLNKDKDRMADTYRLLGTSIKSIPPFPF